MKNALKFLAPLFIFAAGCATSSKLTVLPPVGPDPALVSANSETGFLQVYSMRERIPVDANAEGLFYDFGFGKNKRLFYPAHTGYAIFASDGRLVQWVNNAAGMNDAAPAVVKLAPGLYQITTEALDYDDMILNVMAPVVIEPGLKTAIHLDGNWNPAISDNKCAEMVSLPDGNMVGWHSRKPSYPSLSKSGAD